MVSDCVPENPIKPRHRRLTTAQISILLDGAEQAVLKQIFGRRSVADPRRQEAMKPRTLAENCLDGLFVGGP